MTKGAQRIPLGITPLTSTPVHVFIRNLKTEGEGKVLKSEMTHFLHVHSLLILLCQNTWQSNLRKEGSTLAHGLKVAIHHSGKDMVAGA